MWYLYDVIIRQEIMTIVHTACGNYKFERWENITEDEGARILQDANGKFNSAKWEFEANKNAQTAKKLSDARQNLTIVSAQYSDLMHRNEEVPTLEEALEEIFRTVIR